jgi:hypothetical protein
MFVIRLADGTLRVPQSLTSGDGRLIGNAYVEIAKGDPDYDRWLAESITEEEEGKRRRRWLAENDDLEREFLAYKAARDKTRRDKAVQDKTAQDKTASETGLAGDAVDPGSAPGRDIGADTLGAAGE